MEEKKCCGTCRWSELEDDTDGLVSADGWVCVNGASGNCTESTDRDHTCPEWEART